MAEFFIAAIPWILVVACVLLALLVFGVYIQQLYSEGCHIWKRHKPFQTR